MSAEDWEDPDEPVRLPLTGELDLHAFAPRDIPSVVEEYARACREEGVLNLRLVHGRGKGVQRAVPQIKLAAELPQKLRSERPEKHRQRQDQNGA